MAPSLPDGLRRSVTLADYTTWKVGGPAAFFAEPESTEEPPLRAAPAAPAASARGLGWKSHWDDYRLPCTHTAYSANLHLTQRLI